MSLFVDTPIQYLKGVGPKLGDLLRKRDIHTVGDLLEWFPRTYQDQRAGRSIADLELNQNVSIEATVIRVNSFNMGRSRKKMHEVIVQDSSGRISCKYFRTPYRGYFERFQPQMQVRITGKVTEYRGVRQFQHPTLEPIGENSEDVKDQLLPLYTETEGLSPGKLRKMIDKAIYELIINPKEPDSWKNYSDEYKKPLGVPEIYPDWLLDEYKLMARSEALHKIHQPGNESVDEYLQFNSPAQKRIIFDEFFWLELHLALQKSGYKKAVAPKMGARKNLYDKIISALPFELTNAQKSTLGEVLSDMESGHPMHRLVQGDVGSGKTMVALLSASVAIEHGYQACIMAPTEILAEQHFKNARKIFEPLGIEVAFISGQLRAKEKREVLERVQMGQARLVVGTHAVIQDAVHFNQLGLVIIDEQHRFGVEQRAKLMKKGESPHFLVMTATPIPRTLAMTVYGDLDVSIIDELPKGRQPIVTRKVFENKREKVLGFLQEQVAKGRQAYVVYPLVEESEKIDLKNATEEYEKLVAQFPDIRFALLHGKMKADEKDQVMRCFRDHEFDVLVSTTVIEVGVDVPNANLMLIEHAERFGLSQLHQLRGRVGRGEHKSYCVLMLSYALSDEARFRAEIMESTADGFKISEADLELRGPGQFLGTRQSGLTGFKMANLVRDMATLQLARKAAFQLVQKDPLLKLEEHKVLASEFDRKRKQLVG
ncbi:MAG: ATP-dependent DNA helicase RecG [Bdellovibrionaceae bacterium]|nr:ATP-dependent DNA helicase RecG [Pseudobdellovibrionaceae bacterium]|tara:strand:+ start:29738 stop:31873 length:2136 start_codon:yes stop_codon:yes gene_type:complete